MFKALTSFTMRTKLVIVSALVLLGGQVVPPILNLLPRGVSLYDYGARGDAVVGTTGTVTVAGNVLSDANANFTPADTNKIMAIGGPTAGQLWFNTTSGMLSLYTGASVVHAAMI
jgi:hypothetical protein